MMSHMDAIQTLHDLLSEVRFLHYRTPNQPGAYPPVKFFLDNKAAIDRAAQIFGYDDLKSVPRNQQQHEIYGPAIVTQGPVPNKKSGKAFRDKTAAILLYELERAREWRPKLLVGSVVTLRNNIEEAIMKVAKPDDLLGDDLERDSRDCWTWWDRVSVPDHIFVNISSDEDEDASEAESQSQGAVELPKNTPQKKRVKKTDPEDIKIDRDPVCLAWNSAVESDFNKLTQIVKNVEGHQHAKVGGKKWKTVNARVYDILSDLIIVSSFHSCYYHTQTIEWSGIREQRPCSPPCKI